MNKTTIIKYLTLVGKLTAGAGAVSGVLDPKYAAILFVVSSIIKDTTNTLIAFFTKSLSDDTSK